MSVPLFDTSTPLLPLRAELDAAIARVLDSGHYILGPEVESFEREFATYCGADQAVGVANGTEAITIALRAMGVGPGDEVVVPSFTFYASAEAIPPTGAVPVFCDIDPDTYCVTAATVRAALTPRTKAVIAVHLFGNIAPIAEIEALGVPVLEDAAQAAGSRSPAGRPGSLGTAATFSFFPSKNLGCFGDGGAITTSDAELAERIRVLRFHGSHDKVSYEQIGYNSRLDELQAAILRIQLPHLDTWADGRRAAGAHYKNAGLGELATLPKPVAGTEPAWHLYVVGHPEPERLESALAVAGIGHKPYYRTPVHLQESMRQWSAGAELPATEHAARTHLAIPMSPVLSAEQVAEVVAAARSASSFRVDPLDVGGLLIDVDDVSAALDIAEGRGPES
jgi:dTDP-3-amino-3,4,6-trideoxy-alpha-D-glucose transaminase